MTLALAIIFFGYYTKGMENKTEIGDLEFMKIKNIVHQKTISSDLKGNPQNG